MIVQIRNSIFLKIFWKLIGLYLLNIGIYAPDFNPEHIPENLLYNDQESIVEIIIEKIMGYENAIKEYDDYDSKVYDKKNYIQIDLTIYCQIDFFISQCIYKTKIRARFNFKNSLTNGFYQIDIPPPKI